MSEISYAIDGELNRVRIIKVAPCRDFSFNEFSITEFKDCPLEGLGWVPTNLAIANLASGKEKGKNENNRNQNNNLVFQMKFSSLSFGILFPFSFYKNSIAKIIEIVK